MTTVRAGGRLVGRATALTATEMALADAEAGPTLRALAAAAAGLPLIGLDAGGVAALMTEVAGPAPGAELAEAVHHRCGGNPLFVRELTRLMVARGDFSPDAGPLPSGV